MTSLTNMLTGYSFITQLEENRVVDKLHMILGERVWLNLRVRIYEDIMSKL